jgi:hypothetical protein
MVGSKPKTNSGFSPWLEATLKQIQDFYQG